RGRDQAAAALFMIPALLPLILGVVLEMRLLFKMWSAIQDGEPRTTPGEAIGYLFIPGFNLYWMFQAYWGWARDFNRYVKKQRIDAPHVSEAAPLVLCLLFLGAVLAWLWFPAPWISLCLLFGSAAMLLVFLNSGVDALRAVLAFKRIVYSSPSRAAHG
ncbi:MAG: hypothetical protein N2C14_01525, partial [Planctomycetales bacterium]